MVFLPRVSRLGASQRRASAGSAWSARRVRLELSWSWLSKRGVGTASGSHNEALPGQGPYYSCVRPVGGASCAPCGHMPCMAARGGSRMIFLRRAVTLTAATAMAALVTVAASACGGAPTAISPTTNGLEKKSAAEVLQDAAATLNGAKSVHVVLTGANGDQG